MLGKWQKKLHYIDRFLFDRIANWVKNRCAASLLPLTLTYWPFILHTREFPQSRSAIDNELVSILYRTWTYFNGSDIGTSTEWIYYVQTHPSKSYGLATSQAQRIRLNFVKRPNNLLKLLPLFATLTVSVRLRFTRNCIFNLHVFEYECFPFVYSV